jgi:hypothetical protein
MDKYNLPRVSEDDFNWLLSMGWKDKDDKEFISQECFEHIKRLIDNGSIVFRDDMVVIQRDYTWDEIEG